MTPIGLLQYPHCIVAWHTAVTALTLGCTRGRDGHQSLTN